MQCADSSVLNENVNGGLLVLPAEDISLEALPALTILFPNFQKTWVVMHFINDIVIVIYKICGNM